jgi:hypothetical protein
MQRDWSPTYYFRVRRAEQLLAMYRQDPRGFEALWQAYRTEFGGLRAPHRLSAWLKREDIVFHSCDDIRADTGKRLARALDGPDYLGYTLRITSDTPANLEFYSEASPAALGALTYIAYETRRLYRELKPGDDYRPLPVVSLVEPEDFAVRSGARDAVMHCSGQVFDIDYSGLPPGELECLRFVLNDLGWGGYLGFVEEGLDNMHIGAAPSAREFFTSVFEEAAPPGPSGPVTQVSAP